ncbi:MAG: DJ-1/PfpI family protein, partial [Muribaculaceae bacterium]|nr:DJ-1/PfpI family protein [Muribaculaceae bacterium]
MRESFLFLAEGFEEIEALTAVDVLRRAGMPVRMVSITRSLAVTGAHGITVSADTLFDNTHFTDPAWLLLPGGLPGADNLHDYAPLLGLLKRQADSPDGRIAAICAAPAVVLGAEGMLKGVKATCYPGFEGKLEGAEYIDSRVVEVGKYVLAYGPSS